MVFVFFEENFLQNCAFNQQKNRVGANKSTREMFQKQKSKTWKLFPDSWPDAGYFIKIG